jgi:hypothetical protein
MYSNKNDDEFKIFQMLCYEEQPATGDVIL